MARLSPSMAVALVALLIALGGGAIAASGLDTSAGSKQEVAKSLL